MGYEQFFGLNDAPFSLAPNPRYLFDSATHTAALDQLTTAIERREPLIVMTGEIGTGKTLLCRTVLQRLDRRTFVSVINDPLLESDDLLKQMLQDFGVMSTDRTTIATPSRHDMVHALEDFLSSLIVLNAHAVVIIDEAQHVRPDVLEQIRLLSNIDAPGGTMLQIILVGQQDMEPMLARPELRQFQQRVSRRIRLEPLGERELQSYIDHRLAVGRAAGASMPGAGELARALNDWDGAAGGATFTPDAVQGIWRWSKGFPRVVNLLCDRSLEMACAQRLRTIDAGLIDAAAHVLGLQAEAESQPAPAPIMWSPESVKAEPPAAPVEAIWSPAPVPARPTVEHAEASPVFADVEPPAASRSRLGLIAGLTVLIVIAAAGAWFMMRTPPAPAASSSSTPPRSVAPAPATSTVPAATPPAVPPAAAPAPSAPAAASPAPTRAPATAAAPAPGFEILVASFRTEVRAAAVAEQVSNAGLPVRRRAVAGWLQVIAGPFASREAADAAHQKLDGAGLTGSQIVAVER